MTTQTASVDTRQAELKECYQEVIARMAEYEAACSKPKEPFASAAWIDHHPFYAWLEDVQVNLEYEYRMEFGGSILDEDEQEEGPRINYL
jgi:hypothetical protein